MATKLQKDTVPLVTRFAFLGSNIDVKDECEHHEMRKKGGEMER